VGGFGHGQYDILARTVAIEEHGGALPLRATPLVGVARQLHAFYALLRADFYHPPPPDQDARQGPGRFGVRALAVEPPWLGEWFNHTVFARVLLYM
jgi:hypothetical protein